jgi:hypothetical protein
VFRVGLWPYCEKNRNIDGNPIPRFVAQYLSGVSPISIGAGVRLKDL